MFGQLCVVVEASDKVLEDDAVPVVVVVVVAANEANPYAMNAPTAKIAMTAMRSSDFRLGKDLAFGAGVVPISIFLLHLLRIVWRL